MPSAAELIARAVGLHQTPPEQTAGPPSDQMLNTLELVAAHAELSLQQAAVRKQETERALLRDRHRIATGLHDSVAQMLFAIGVA